MILCEPLRLRALCVKTALPESIPLFMKIPGISQDFLMWDVMILTSMGHGLR